MRLPDAPTIEPSRVLPRGDGDGCDGCSLLPFYSDQNDRFGDGALVCPYSYTPFYRRTGDNYTETTYFSGLCRWSGDRHGARNDNPILGGE